MVWEEDKINKQCGPKSSESKLFLKLDSMFYDFLMLWLSKLFF